MNYIPPREFALIRKAILRWFCAHRFSPFGGRNVRRMASRRVESARRRFSRISSSVLRLVRGMDGPSPADRPPEELSAEWLDPLTAGSCGRACMLPASCGRTRCTPRRASCPNAIPAAHTVRVDHGGTSGPARPAGARRRNQLASTCGLVQRFPSGFRRCASTAALYVDGGLLGRAAALGGRAHGRRPRHRLNVLTALPFRVLTVCCRHAPAQLGARSHPHRAFHPARPAEGHAVCWSRDAFSRDRTGRAGR